MNPTEIANFLHSFSDKLSRTIVIVDFSNVEKWKANLGWSVGIQELARLVKTMSAGNIILRRFYYGSDFGPKEKSPTLTLWSGSMLERARMNRFEVVTKAVKYIHTEGAYAKKCDLDVEMAVDLIRLQEQYDNIVLFSGDGDLVYALRYLHDTYGKKSYVFGARGHVGKEVVDAAREGLLQKLLYCDDFKYRLDKDRFRNS